MRRALDALTGVTVVRRGDVLTARAVSDGAEVAGGCVGLWRGWAVFDSLGVSADQRRRGWGRAVMASLSESARRAGARRGVLSATPSGRALYAAIGWREVGGQVCASRRPPSTGPGLDTAGRGPRRRDEGRHVQDDGGS